MKHTSEKVLMFIVDGFEEIEAITPIDLLRRAKISIDTVSIKNDKKVISARGVPIITDKNIDEINFDEYRMIILHGGPGIENYLKSSLLIEKLKEFSIGKEVSAICAAPTILSKIGILKGRKATCFPECEKEIIKDGAILELGNVIQDDNIITSKSAGTAIDFSLEIIRKIKGKEMKEKISKQIIYDL